MHGFRPSRPLWVAASKPKALGMGRPAFTLLELLVAMTLMVAAASCLYTALYTGFRARRSAQTAVEPTATAINAIELVKQDLCGVLPPGSALAGAFLGTDSAGIKGVEADSVSFFTTHIYASEEQPAGGLGKIELVLEEDSEASDGTYRLLRRVTTNLLPLRTAEAEEQVLCRGVAALNFRFYDGNDWVDAWDSTADANSLPRAVEVDIQIARQAAQRARELQKRRLIQSFALPCETAAQQTTTASGT